MSYFVIVDENYDIKNLTWARLEANRLKGKSFRHCQDIVVLYCTVNSAKMANCWQHVLQIQAFYFGTYRQGNLFARSKATQLM